MDQLELRHIETLGDCYVRYHATRPTNSVLATVIINANAAPATVRVFRGSSHDPADLIGQIDLPE